MKVNVTREGRVYGKDKTYLRLTELAQKAYDETEPLEIREFFTPDGYLYDMSGVIEGDFMTELAVNIALEGLRDGYDD